MKKLLTTPVYVVLLLLTGLVACKKDEVLNPQPPMPGNPPTQPVENTLKIRIRAEVTVGDIVYDSIPAAITIRSWDAAGNMFSKDTLVAAGTNEITLPATHTRYSIQMEKWGLTDELQLLRNQVNVHTVYMLQATTTAKKLRIKEEFTLINGQYVASGKSVYNYSSGGKLDKVQYFQKLPQYSDLQLTVLDQYEYAGNAVTKIDRFDGKNSATGFTEFMYDANGKMVNMHQKSYDQETWSAVEYGTAQGKSLVTIDYLYSNGNAMEYSLEFTGGNKIKDAALSSTGGGESGTYRYDFNINPFAHMNMPDLFLANQSKNNLVASEKSYSGSIPSAEPYHYEYVYDAQGYPVQLIRKFKNYSTGQHLYTTKTVFTY